MYICACVCVQVHFLIILQQQQRLLEFFNNLTTYGTIQRLDAEWHCCLSWIKKMVTVKELFLKQIILLRSNKFLRKMYKKNLFQLHQIAVKNRDVTNPSVIQSFSNVSSFFSSFVIQQC